MLVNARDTAMNAPRKIGFVARIPLPVLAVVVGLLSGLGIWLVLDRVQTVALDNIFESQLEERLDEEAREAMARFDDYLKRYSTTVRLLSSHVRMANYLEPLYWFENDFVEPVAYNKVMPPWLPDGERWGRLAQTGYILLIDNQGRTREIFQGIDENYPDEIVEFDNEILEASLDEPYLINIGDRLFALASGIAQDASGSVMGVMALLVPIDEVFLRDSQQHLGPDAPLIGIVSEDERRVVVSSNLKEIPENIKIRRLRHYYFVRFQAFFDYQGLDKNLKFITLIPRATIERTLASIQSIEHQQRLIQAAVFIVIYTLVIYLVSARITRALRRISRFSQRALGLVQHFEPRGNQLFIMENWIHQFIRLVRTAREEMKLQHESEMRETEALKSAVMQATLDAIATVDSQGRIIDFNQSAQDMFGSRADEVFWRPLDQLISPNDRDSFNRMLGGMRGLPGQEGIHGHMELMALRADGRKFPAEVNALPYTLESQLVVTVAFRDITARKNADMEISQLARFASESPSPVIRVNSVGVIMYANDASEPLLRYWGCDRQQTLPLYWRNMIREVLEKSSNTEIELASDDGIFSLLLAPVGESGYVNIYARDITEIRVAEQLARSHQSELVHVCRLSTMGEVSTGMAHELNQPLAAIVNYASGCIRRIENGADTADILPGLEQISAQASRAGQIIKRLRGMVAKQSVVREIADINNLLSEVLTFIEFDIKKARVKVVQKLDAQPLRALVDPVQIEQVMMNLMKNALDAIADANPKQRQIEVQSLLDDATIRIYITDSAHGLESSQLSQLFDAFFTTKESGMGMGLAISQTIINDHAGRIWVELSPAGLTRFCIELPAHVDDAVSPVEEYEVNDE